MAEALLSAFLQALFDGMASPEFADFFQQRKLNKGVLKKLKIALLSVHKLQEDAEGKQLIDHSVGKWLYKLKDAVYDAEDVLDEIATEALQRKLDVEFQTTAIDGKSEDVESFPEPGLLPSCLTELRIYGFPNMKSLDKKGLQHLTSLRQLSVHDCPKLKNMPEGLPTSLSTVEIQSCPLLRKRWQSKKGKERRKIPDVNHILIDKELIE